MRGSDGKDVGGAGGDRMQGSDGKDVWGAGGDRMQGSDGKDVWDDRTPAGIADWRGLVGAMSAPLLFARVSGALLVAGLVVATMLRT